MPKRPETTSETVEKLQREITKAQGLLVGEHRLRETNSKRLARARRSLSGASPGSRDESRALDEIAYCEQRINSHERQKSRLERLIAEKNVALSKYQDKLARERDQQYSRSLTQIRAAEARLKQRVAQETSLKTKAPTVSPLDAFISHATEDKEDVVKPLANGLRQLEINLWYDEYDLKVGDSLRRKIDEGLARSRFGIVVLSPAFFAKNWPQYELDGLVAKEMQGGQNVILPLWHKISKDEVLRHSPSLADKVALSTSQYTITELTWELYRRIRYIQPTTGQ